MPNGVMQKWDYPARIFFNEILRIEMIFENLTGVNIQNSRGRFSQ
jgi:hypothetical protein